MTKEQKRKKLQNRGNSNRARMRKRMRELDPDAIDSNFWIYLAARQNQDGTYSLRRYGSGLDALRDIQGAHVHASKDQEQFFDYIRNEQFKVDHPTVFSSTTFIVGFPQESLRHQYARYGKAAKRADRDRISR